MKEKKNRFKKVILVLLVMFLLTGCTKNLKNECMTWIKNIPGKKRICRLPEEAA